MEIRHCAWLGWLFDGWTCTYTRLVAAPFVMQLLAASSLADPQVKRYSSWIQAAFPHWLGAGRRFLWTCWRLCWAAAGH
jgi:hypothetical protein